MGFDQLYLCIAQRDRFGIAPPLSRRGSVVDRVGNFSGPPPEPSLLWRRRSNEVPVLDRYPLSGLLSGAYPVDMLEHYSKVGPGFSVIAEGDLEVISAPLDFLGINYYFPMLVAARGREREATRVGFCVGGQEANPVDEDLGVIGVHRPEQPRTLMGWEVDAPAMKDLLTGLSASFQLPPVYVTENGASFADYLGPDGAVRDGERSAYIESHLRAVHGAISGGVDVRGYFVWSFLDNFEWGHGYSKRFGLVWVDYPSGTRQPKDSFGWYRKVVRSNQVPPPG